jgi:hypothetical protein
MHRFNVDDYEYMNLASDARFTTIKLQLQQQLVATVGAWQHD